MGFCADYCMLGGISNLFSNTLSQTALFITKNQIQHIGSYQQNRKMNCIIYTIKYYCNKKELFIHATWIKTWSIFFERKKPFMKQYLLYNSIYISPCTGKYMVEKNQKFWLFLGVMVMFYTLIDIWDIRMYTVCQKLWYICDLWICL